MTAKRHAPAPAWVALPLIALMVSTTPSAEAAPQLCAAPWQRLGRNAEELARPLPLGLLAAAALPPVVLSPTGVDYDLRRFAQTDLGGAYRAESVTVAAPYVALASTLLFWSSSVLFSSCKMQKAPTAMLQGATWTLLVVGLTKWAVGRTWPTGGRDPYGSDRLDHPEDGQTYAPFAAGLAAFPSGHTAIMFSLAAALRTSSPELGTFRYLGYPLAAGVGFGMWFGDHHWASDVLSGALIGEALGGSAGRAWLPSSDVTVAYLIVPLPSGLGAGVVGQF